MFKTLIRLVRGSIGQNAEPVVRQIVEKCLVEVCDQVEGHLQGMTLSEARGYVRARATRVVMREVRAVIASSSNLEFVSMAVIVRHATERLIPRVIRRTYVSATRLSRVAA